MEEDRRQGKYLSKITSIAGFHIVPILLFQINGYLETNPKISLAASGALP